MKKVIVVLSAFVAIAIAGIFLFIPSVLEIKSSVKIGTSQQGLHRMLPNNSSITKWWPGEIQHTKNETRYFLNGYQYKIHDNNISLLGISITNLQDSISSALYLFSQGIDSVNVEWVYKIATSINPIKRLIAYQKAKRLKNDMDTVLEKMKSHFSK